MWIVEYQDLDGNWITVYSGTDYEGESDENSMVLCYTDHYLNEGFNVRVTTMNADPVEVE